MSLTIDLKRFDELYNKQLLPKEQILKELNMTEYFYKKIIKEFNIKRNKRTCEFERIKNANKDFIIIIKQPEETSNEDKKPKIVSKERLNTLKNIEKRQQQQKETSNDETKYNQAMNEAMNILKTTKKTLRDKEIF